MTRCFVYSGRRKGTCDQRPQHTSCFGYARRGLRPYGRRGGGPLSRVSNPFLATQPLQANQRTYLGKRPTSRSIHTIHYVQTGREAQMDLLRWTCTPRTADLSSRPTHSAPRVVRSYANPSCCSHPCETASAARLRRVVAKRHALPTEPATDPSSCRLTAHAVGQTLVYLRKTQLVPCVLI